MGNAHPPLTCPPSDLPCRRLREISREASETLGLLLLQAVHHASSPDPTQLRRQHPRLKRAHLRPPLHLNRLPLQRRPEEQELQPPQRRRSQRKRPPLQSPS